MNGLWAKPQPLNDKNMARILCKTIGLLLLLPLWSGCTTIVTTKGELSTPEKLESMVVNGWDNPNNMRELGVMKVPVADLKLDKPDKPFNRNTTADSNGNCPAGTVPYFSTKKGQNFINKTVIASGYGAPPSRLLSPMQKRLLALRAAKLDAIRTLAERVSGIHIWGGATMSDLAIKSDRIHVQLDSFVKGARMIALNHMNDGSYEAVMEIKFNLTVMQRLKMNKCLPADQVLKMQYSSL